jgi:hypothetical protein
MRRVLGLLGVLAVAACSTPPPEPPAGDYHVYGSPEELVAASDLIVQGIVVDSRVQLAAPPDVEPTDTANGTAAPTATGGPRVVVTVVTLTVIDVFKGPVAVGDEIEVAQPGGRYRGVDFTDTASTLMRVGQPAGYVLLLRRGAHDVYYLPNPQQAMFTVTGEGDLTGVGQRALSIATTADLHALAASP